MQLNADQAIRAQMGAGIETFGYWFTKGNTFVCSPCWRQPGGGYPPSMRGQGYAIPVYGISGHEHRVRGRCQLCGQKIDGEVMRLSLPVGTRNPSQPGLTLGIGP